MASSGGDTICVFGPYEKSAYPGFVFYQFLVVPLALGITESPDEPPYGIASNATIIMTWHPPSGIVGKTADITLVGGGGAGCAVRTDNEFARACGGGSGFVTNSTIVLASSIAIHIGKGGTECIAAAHTSVSTPVIPTSANGMPTIFGSIVANGGYFGTGGWQGANGHGGNGGSGGGGSGFGGGSNGNYGGGTSVPMQPGSGQGYPLSFVDGILRAGGGGGASVDTRDRDPVMLGSGGAGGGGNAGGDTYNSASAYSGINGYGGGGGACGGGYYPMISGAGGSGCIILKVPAESIRVYSGIPIMTR